MPMQPSPKADTRGPFRPRVRVSMRSIKPRWKKSKTPRSVFGESEPSSIQAAHAPVRSGGQSTSLSLCAEAKLGGFEGMSLRHRFFGAIQTIEDEFAEKRITDLAGYL